MNDNEVQEYFSEEDINLFIEYFIEKGLSYGQALCVSETISRFIDVGIKNALKELGVG